MQFYGSSFKVNEYLSNITLTQVSQQKSCISEPYIINYVDVDKKQIKNIVMKDKTIIWPYGLLEFENGLKYYSNVVHDNIFRYSINGNTIFVQPYQAVVNSYSQYQFKNMEEKFYLKDNLYVQKKENGNLCFYIETEFYTYELWSVQGISIVKINDDEKIVTYSYSKYNKYLNFRDANDENIRSYNFNGEIVE